MHNDSLHVNLRPVASFSDTKIFNNFEDDGLSGYIIIKNW